MRGVILYRPKTEQEGLAQDYARDFSHNRPDRRLELLSLDTVEGAAMAKLYDVVRYPAILALGPDGNLQQLWQDQPFPLMDEVASYLRAE